MSLKTINDVCLHCKRAIKGVWYSTANGWLCATCQDREILRERNAWKKKMPRKEQKSL